MPVIVDSLICAHAGHDMCNLAQTYQKLGRCREALALQEKTLEFFQRVLPENHPRIGVRWLHLEIMRVLLIFTSGEMMGNLAVFYGENGRNEDALDMDQRALEFQRRVLPEDHPNIGLSAFCSLLCFQSRCDVRQGLPCEILPLLCAH